MSDGTETTKIADEYRETPVPRGRAATVAVGDILNGIYKVERFVARGGMGEVFEGVNVETDERVALKAIRSHLASDPKIVALFRKEARILTHISHPVIVQYRVFARDPLLDLHYIVTDFINGEPITVHLDGDRPEIRDVVTLGRRLAAGLEAAHEHGAIHRDMSPDNVLLPDGKIERAKIIDFGIAKSLDITAETVVGDGFAGKLGYVAPEQFGDFGRHIGPWTDIYSTALVLLAHARGKAPPMGTTLSEAVERRRAAPDVTDLPPALAPLFEAMLVPDPASRIRSMREVLAGLDNVRLPDDAAIEIQSAPASAPVPEAKPAPPPPADETDPGTSAPGSAGEATMMTTFVPAPGPPGSPVERIESPGGAAPAESARSVPRLPSRAAGSAPARRWNRRWLYIGLPATGVVAVAALTVNRAPDAVPSVSISSEQRAPSAPVAAPQLSATDRAARLGALLADMPCTWVSARPTAEGGPTALSGGAGDLAAIGNRLASPSQALGRAETAEILPVNVTQCGAIDALRPFHVDGVRRDAGALSLSASNIARDANPACPGAGTAEITVANYDPQSEIALLLLQSDGQLLQIAGTREEFASRARQNPDRFNVGADGAYHASTCYTLTGSAAVFLIKSRGAIDLGLRTGVASLPPADFARRVADQGRAQQMRVLAEWVGVDPGQPDAVGETAGDGSAAAGPVADRGAVPASPRAAPARGSRLDRARAQSAIDTADANRVELERIKALRNGVGDTNASGVSCRAFDGHWKDVGKLSRDQCISRAIRGRCQVSFAKYKNHLFRRQGGTIQEQRGKRWKDVTSDGGC